MEIMRQPWQLQFKNGFSDLLAPGNPQKFLFLKKDNLIGGMVA